MISVISNDNQQRNMFDVDALIETAISDINKQDSLQPEVSFEDWHRDIYLNYDYIIMIDTKLYDDNSIIDKFCSKPFNEVLKEIKRLNSIAKISDTRMALSEEPLLKYSHHLEIDPILINGFHLNFKRNHLFFMFGASIRTTIQNFIKNLLWICDSSKDKNILIFKAYKNSTYFEQLRGNYSYRTIERFTYSAIPACFDLRKLDIFERVKFKNNNVESFSPFNMAGNIRCLDFMMSIEGSEKYESLVFKKFKRFFDNVPRW